MPSQTRHWCFTLNNYTEDEVATLDILGRSDETSYLVYGFEVGESGTPHLQGYVVFASVKRLSAAKLKIGQRAHLEARRGTSYEAAQYCKKDGDFKEYGTAPAEVGGHSHIEKYRRWLIDFANENGRRPTEKEIATNQTSIWLRYRRNAVDLARFICPGPKLVPPAQEPRDWQFELESDLSDEADDRSIKFFVDLDGGKGKSWFQRYMLTKFPDKVQLLSCGKRDDIAYAIDETKSIFLFNIPRDNMQFLQYPILEQLKDRTIFSPKYESALKILDVVPHVVVFSNELPDETKLSADRYDITMMD